MPSPVVETAFAVLARVRAELGRTLVGQSALADRLLIGLATGGHLLLEGPPGVAKTLAAKALAAAVGLSFKRIQFTPDLLPADLLGGEVYHAGSGTFTLREGPIFANLVLADEINRAPAKVQSALLEGMQEGQATLGLETRPLPRPFLVIATQNPVEQQGVYALPEAQADRFLLKPLVAYPTREEERAILHRHGPVAPESRPAAAVATLAEVAALPAAGDAGHLEPRLEDYILARVRGTRDLAAAGKLALGASPRATLALARAARAAALLAGREFVLPEDIKGLAKDVLRHRLAPAFDALADGVGTEALLDRLLASVRTP